MADTERALESLAEAHFEDEMSPRATLHKNTGLLAAAVNSGDEMNV